MRRVLFRLISICVVGSLLMSMVPVAAFGIAEDLDANAESASGMRNDAVPSVSDDGQDIEDGDLRSEPDDGMGSEDADAGEMTDSSENDPSILTPDAEEDSGQEEGEPVALEEVQPDDNITAFVKRLYRYVLERDADAGGLKAHADGLRSGGSAASVAWAFFGSPEFQNRSLTDDRRLEIAYLAMFDRGADPSGRETYGAMLKTGMSMRAVISAFSNSPEYRALCTKWGVAPGVLSVTENRDKNKNATAFVQRLYEKVLDRTADIGGLNAHTGSLVSGGDAASLAWVFFGSSEFTGRGLSNAQKVEVIYEAMLDRSSDPAGKAEWVAKLDSGQTLRSVISGFAGSDEFKRLCQGYGIAPDRYWTMDSRANGLSSRTRWLIAVDTNKCLVTVYTGSKGNWTPARRFDCAPGKASTPSRKGVFSVGVKGYVFGSGYSCYYFTQYSDDYLFHSILYNPGTFTVQDGTMGRPVSHGCIRLWVENAKYIYDNVPSGSTVLVF